MSQFDTARAKYEKNRERNEKYRAVVTDAVGTEVPKVTVSTEQIVVETPKEKAINRDGIIQVVVSLPIGEFEMLFRKRNVMENVNKSKMTKTEFSNALAKALEPLLGRVEVL